jgi:four helix bundle protein
MIYNGKEIELADEFTEVEENSRPYNIRHRAYYFSRDIVCFVTTAEYDRVFASMFDQLLRSATSIGANIVEAKSGSSKKDFVNYLRIALKSANETKYWLCLIRDTMDVDKNKIQLFLEEVNELSRIVAAIIVNNINSKIKS